MGSLFSGIGLLELGLEWAGLGPVAWQVEQDAWCRGVLARHWPRAKRYEDVRAVGAELEEVDLICGGFPCQDISYAGNGAGIEGERSGLWREQCRIICLLRPRYVLVENVAALLVRGVDRVLGDLAEAGYDAEWSCVRASDVGAPHRRERLFILAYTDDAGRARSVAREASAGLAAAGAGGEAVADAGRLVRERARGGGDLQGATGEAASEGNQRQRLRNAPRDRREAVADTDMRRREGVGRRRVQHGDATRGDDAGGCSGETAECGRSAESGVGRDVDGLPARVDRWPAGPGEAPQTWEPPRTVLSPEGRAARRLRVARLKALGNAVVPHVAELWGRRVMELEAIRRGGGQ
ncbi:DNA cytosine methyltransferase [Polyangium fumosum]|uniref:Cytosine-specific methyltransferase n=2 Tax=Polyangium fumosum TaxID=889272 RepID=A0A4U1J1I5_9BACT|nr:DNA cytosine methyltransferase [Polyangium fumosum]